MAKQLEREREEIKRKEIERKEQERRKQEELQRAEDDNRTTVKKKEERGDFRISNFNKEE